MDIQAAVTSVVRSGILNIVLWAATFAAGLLVLLWVLFAGPATQAKDRAEAISSLWTVVSPWLLALAAKSKITGDQKTAVLENQGVSA